MKTITKESIIYAVVKINDKCKTIKVIKNQLFTDNNGIADHLIGNLYLSIFRHRHIDIIKEKSNCHIKPIILSKFTFRHTPHLKKSKKSLFNKPHFLYLKDY